MCGIVGVFSRSAPIAPETLERATKSLYHRGPDGQQWWMSPDRRVGLGHARLSIIDLTTGDQPIANEDEKLRIIVNGELYDYEAVQKELEQSGHRLRTKSDSEIALHLYEELGAHCLQRLRGEFAIILWDSVNRTLFAARDRFGIKPLFYSLHENTLYLASEVKAIFAAGVPARWDPEAVYNSFEFGGPQMRTLYDGVFQIPPGHYMIATEQRLQLKQYWDFNYPKIGETGPDRSDAEYAEEFRRTLEDSVRMRLRADVPVGCYLSGGVDSCAILGLAAKHHPEPIHAFTLSFDRPEFDEANVAAEMASRVGAKFCPIPIRQDEIADNVVDAIAQAETFFANSHGAAKYLLSRAVRDAGYKVVLTGEGSDEILGGYMHFHREAGLHHIDPKALAGTAPALKGPSPNGHARTIEGVKRLLGFVPSWIEISAMQSRKMKSLLAEGFLNTYRDREGFRSFFNDIDVSGQLAGREPLHQSLYLWSKTRLPNYLLTVLGDRMEMGHSIEGRVPFLDHRLVEVMRAQPVTQKIRGSVHKFVLREALRDILTETVHARPKQAFLSPPAMLNPTGRYSVLLQDTLRGPALASLPFFDKTKVINLLDGLHASGDNSGVANDEVLITLLSACVLQNRYRISSN
jgi:asparagine synthase (glutamine-hydrolysing)